MPIENSRKDDAQPKTAMPDQVKVKAELTRQLLVGMRHLFMDNRIVCSIAQPQAIDN